MVTPKMKALAGASVAGLTALLAYLANTPPEAQDALVGPIVALLPLAWRPTFGLVMRGLSSVATIYMAIQASHSGPATKPATDAQTGAPTPSLPAIPPNIQP